MGYTEPANIGDYVTKIVGAIRAPQDTEYFLLLGPYPSAREALQHVETGRRLEKARDPINGHWANCGSTRIVYPVGTPLPKGQLNVLLSPDELAARALPDATPDPRYLPGHERIVTGQISPVTARTLERVEVPEGSYRVVAQSERSFAASSSLSRKQAFLVREGLQRENPQGEVIVISRHNDRRAIWTHPHGTPVTVSDAALSFDPSLPKAKALRIPKDVNLYSSQDPTSFPYQQGTIVARRIGNDGHKRYQLLLVTNVIESRNETSAWIQVIDAEKHRTTHRVSADGYSDTIRPLHQAQYDAVVSPIRHPLRDEFGDIVGDELTDRDILDLNVARLVLLGEQLIVPDAPQTAGQVSEALTTAPVRSETLSYEQPAMFL